MKYTSYLGSCRRGRSWARTRSEGDANDPIGYSELHLLKGNPRSALTAITGIRDKRAAYLQAVKAYQHFADSTFLDGREASPPSPSSADWTLPILRAAGRAARSREDARRLEEHCYATSKRLPEARVVSALMVVSHCHRDVGDLASSRRLLARAFQIASSMQIHAAQPSGDKQVVFSHRRQAAFHDLLRVTDLWQHSLFLCSGTLLGFYRGGDFIPSDGDVDLGTTDPSGFSSLREGLRSSGRFYLSTGRLQSTLKAKHANGTKIDISLYESRGDSWAKTSHVYEWKFERFELGELATDYGRLPVPVPTEDYLCSMYEDWWVPRSGYDSRIHSPNLTHVSPEEVALVLSGHYLTTYLRGGKAACAGWDKKFEGLTSETRRHLTPLIQILR